MTDFRTAKILSHRRNIQRYASLLATELTELAELERLQTSPPEQARPRIAAAAADASEVERPL